MGIDGDHTAQLGCSHVLYDHCMTSVSTQEISPTPTSDRTWAITAVVLSIIGFAASATLVMERLALFKDAGHVPSCDLATWMSCGTVMRTPQAEVFGFPNPFIGIVAYAMVLVVAVGVLAGARYAAWFWWLLWAGIALGSVFTLWLWWQTTFNINTLCLYCMVVWCAQTWLLASTTARNARAGLLGEKAASKTGTTAWAWLIGTGLLIVAFGVIAVRFASVLYA